MSDSAIADITDAAASSEAIEHICLAAFGISVGTAMTAAKMPAPTVCKARSGTGASSSAVTR